jgi:16S rRNA (uracil1498-N3)-methyltransferase
LLPLFYQQHINAANSSVTLDENASKHIVQVLRKSMGSKLQLTDGIGNKYLATIINDHKKKCEVKIIDTVFTFRQTPGISIAISPIKNTSRFEWFLEKATEIGVSEIIPLICERTEKEHFRYERMQQILVSAMLQSQQVWLPQLQQPTKFYEVITKTTQPIKLIAHCVEEQKQSLAGININEDAFILIGPEGDFTTTEITQALQQNFTAVTLSNNRLRTETAGVVAATLLRIR